MSGKRWIIGVLACLAFKGLAGPLTEVEITPDPVQNGSQIFTLRMTPGETRTYDVLVFDCVYHQEFVPKTSDRTDRKKAHEPQAFTVRRRDVKMVEELDVNISFRVPIALDRLKEMYGPNAFDPEHPVTISRIKISAMNSGVVVWWYEFDAKGLHRPVETGGEKALKKEGLVP